MDAVGLRIGQTWFNINGGSIVKYILEGYLPGRDVFILDVGGLKKRMFNEEFSKIELFNKRTDAVSALKAFNDAFLNEEIATKQAELDGLIAQRDVING